MLQAFWWDYYNGAYPLKWADYLTELPPRLKGMGIDAVWIPPTPKNGGTNGVGYSHFDHYDLGDKFQKNDTRTRFGTKDEFLRMVVVMRANGIEVIQDIVLNHIDNASAGNGADGVDPNSYSVQSSSGYKNFRYACFGTPVPQTGGENATEYLNRRGRWSKNYTNFHPHFGHNSMSGAMAESMSGADFCFGDDGGGDGYGPSTNAAYNPTQNAGYSRDEARKWIVWLQKQTGVDGFRWDAVKHFSYPIQQDLSYNLKYSAGSSAALALNNLTINNAANARLLSPVSVSGVLAFTTGRLAIDNQNLTLDTAATVTGADASRYVITPDVAGTGGFVVRSVPGNGTAVTFPVGTMDSFMPLTLANSGTGTTFRVRTFSGLLTNGTSGTPYSRAADFVNRTWEVTPTLATGPVVAMSLQYNAAERNSSFVPSQAKVYRNRGGAGEVWTELGRATTTGSGPFVGTYAGISSFSKFALGNSSTPLPVTLTRFEGRAAPSPVPCAWTGPRRWKKTMPALTSKNRPMARNSAV